MDFKKVSEINQPFLEVVVNDYISKKRYFADSEVTGWLLMKEGDETKMFHLYRRGFNEQNKKEINEPLIFTNEQLVGNDFKREKQTLLDEAELQVSTGENKDILERIKSFI